MISLPSERCKCALCVALLLPSELQNALFCEWLDLFDLGRLDSAVCNSAHRDNLLAAWNDAHCIMGKSSTTDILVNASFAGWVGSRRIKIGTVVAIPEFVAETEAGMAFFEATGNTLKAIKYPEIFTGQSMDSAQSIISMQSVVERASLCPNLEKISIDLLNMKKVSLRALLNNCTKLKVLVLVFADDINFQELNECGKYIEYLHLVALRIESPPEESTVLTKSNNLKKLHCVSNTGNCDQLVEFICSNVGLRELRVDHIARQDALRIMEPCTELVALHLEVVGDNTLSNNDISRLIPLLQNMRCLKLINFYFAEAWLLPLLQGCAHLQTLFLWNFSDTDGASQGLSYDMHPDGADPPLTALHVWTIAAPVLAQVLRSYPLLTNVGIGQSTPESFDAALLVLEEYEMIELHLTVPPNYAYANIHLLHDLSALYLHKCEGLVDEHLLTIAHHNPHLSVLHLVGTEVTSDGGVIALVKMCQQLTALYIYEEYFYDQDESLNETLKALCPSLVTVDVRFPHLSTLRLRNANLITSVGLIGLVKACQHLKSLRMDSGSKAYPKEKKPVNRKLKTLCPTLVDLDVYVCE